MDAAGRWRRWVPWAVWGLLVAGALVAWALCPVSMKTTVALWAGTPLGVAAIPLALLSLRNGRSKPSGTLKVEVAEPVVIQQSVPPPPASRPVEVGRPPMRPPAFQPRTSYREQIDQLWAGTSTVVLHGDGGGGKSQLARECFASSSSSVRVWVEASSVDGIITAYATAFQKRAVEIAADQPGVRPAETNAEAQAEAFRGWLHSTDTSWLVVMDDLDVEPESLGTWWPSGSGKVLVTTRRSDVGYLTFYDPRDVIELGVYKSAEALSYVHQRLIPHAVRLGPGYLDGAPALVEALGRHPVALNQATAVIIDEGKTTVTYLARFNDRTRTLEDLFAQQDLAYDRKTVAATWSIALDRASLHSPHATATAGLLSVVHPTMTPRCLFTTEAVRRHLARALDPGTETMVSSDEADAALRVLERVALIRMGPDLWGSIAIHALAQRAVHDIAPDDQRICITTMAGAAMEAWPSKDLDLAVGAQLRSIIEHMYSEDSGAFFQNGAHPALRRVGVSFAGAGNYREGMVYGEKVLADIRLEFGDRHIDTFRIRYDLAIRKGAIGDIDSAVVELSRLVADEQGVLAPDHEETLKARSQLARWRGRSGDFKGAVVELEKVLDAERESLGPEHVAVLQSRHNLAVFRRRAGNFEGAVRELKDLVAIKIAVLGPEDPSTLNSKNQLAVCRGVAGDPARAVHELEDVLRVREQVLKPGHPDVVGTRILLARWRGEAGDPARAVRELEETLPVRIGMYGGSDQRTLSTRFLLARSRGEAGDPAYAVRELAEVLYAQTLILGKVNPDVLDTRHQLGRWRGESGDAAGAVCELEGVLDARHAMLGPDHPKTLDTRYELARWSGEVADPARAAQELEEVLVVQTRVLPDGHPNVLLTRRALARLQNGANRRAHQRRRPGQAVDG